MFDTVAARNAITPVTSVTPGAPAANSAGAVFVTTGCTLTRDRFDESVAKHVIRKCFREKHERFSGTESHAQGTSDLLGVRFKANTDPSDSTADFNAALKSARRKNTLDDDEVKEPFIAALDSVFYAPAGTHLAVSAAAMTDEGDVSQLADLTAITLDVKKQFKFRFRPISRFIRAHDDISVIAA
ncbi:hypothetical protein CYMTET_29134 [Cymbomonas tetramitiformis]|uniref:Uncharacterized protein n=1 Tax=Cymbomonas tetramitiformis TaxID=36881 RepID=A0AAE0FLM3_9CHLO|nr:hypothetical protein CYMTET_29134 [Cymbomonas tetramitiformis]